tara:strand:+ start:809 stop:1279 length:471 start_codon:yes stop_codon:yes gene_type:complete
MATTIRGSDNFDTADVGKVLQVVQSSTSTEIGNSTTTFSNTGLSATITPTSATSKVLVIVNQNGGYKNAGSLENGLMLKLVRDAADIVDFGYRVGWTQSAAPHFAASISTNYLDAPATTSATIYKTQFSNYTAASAVYVQINSLATSTITLIEIGA